LIQNIPWSIQQEAMPEIDNQAMQVTGDINPEEVNFSDPYGENHDRIINGLNLNFLRVLTVRDYQ